MTSRIERIQKTIRARKKFPYFVSSVVNVKYLTEFAGSYAAMVIDRDAIYFISDSRYEEYARKLLPESVNFVLQERDLCTALKSILKTTGRTRLFLEEHDLSLSLFNVMKKRMRGTTLVPAGDQINEMRMVKEEGEIAVIAEAVALADRCFEHIITLAKPGVLEWDLAVEIEYFYRKNGCTKTSFDSIVASGTGSSMPHYETSMTKRIAQGDILLIDMGCVYQGYNSDLTRTVFVGSIAPDFRHIYDTVRRAQEAAIDAVRPGMTTGRLDATARRVIADAGCGDRFGHSLGHGVGLEVHELPAVRPRGDIRLKKNMVITIEPGIYMPDAGGVRIEDMVVVSPGGCRVLTRATKDIVII
ncbi:MAG TPA: aminopeptidase P family protein [Spirochaetota bacterium]|nr:aminopeptidase P family protein [Spirochaetota bacterium]